jgi:hypothetical protein
MRAMLVVLLSMQKRKPASFPEADRCVALSWNFSPYGASPPERSRAVQLDTQQQQ